MRRLVTPAPWPNGPKFPRTRFEEARERFADLLAVIDHALESLRPLVLRHEAIGEYDDQDWAEAVRRLEPIYQAEAYFAVHELDEPEPDGKESLRAAITRLHWLENVEPKRQTVGMLEATAETLRRCLGERQAKRPPRKRRGRQPRGRMDCAATLKLTFESNPEAAGWTMEKLANTIGFSKSSISRAMKKNEVAASVQAQSKQTKRLRTRYDV